MKPVFIYTIILCGLFWFVYSKRVKNKTASEYAIGELIPFFALSRLVPLFMMESRSSANYVAFGIDLIVMAAVCFTASKLTKSPKVAAAVYMFTPLPVISIATGSRAAMFINIIAAVIAMGWTVWAVNRSPLSSPSAYIGGYSVLCTGTYLCAYCLFVQEFKAKEMFGTLYYPTFFVAGAVLVIAGIIMLSVKASKIKKQPAVSGKEAASVPEAPSYTPEKFGKKNIIHIIVLTAVYAVVVLFRLGSHEAPETGQKFNSNDPDNAEIIIDLGEYISAKELQIFLGQESLRKISVSTYNEVEKKWINITEEEELKTAFAWNKVDMAWSLRYIGIVFSGEDTHVNEIVIVDSDGNPVMPANASDRPYLFDEQNKYPDVPTYYYRMMFDEIYHGRTGYEFLHNLSIYENTHPPLGKTIIAGGIAVFGMNPFGWRIMVAIFGTLMVPLMYIFAWKISKRSDTALMGGVLLSAECMHFTLSRIATIDIIVALFILMMFMFMFCFVDEIHRNGPFKKQVLWLMLSGVSMGLACATKWTGVYAAGGIAVIFAVFLIKHCTGQKKTFKEQLPYLLKLCGVCVAAFIIIPGTMYTLSYFEFVQSYPDKGIIKHMLENAQSMFSYHSGVYDSHPYESPWYDWLTDKQPLLDAINSFPDDKVSSVATFANPFIAFGGLLAFFHNVYLWRNNKNMRAQFLAISYIAMLMPWFFIHRTVFIYQYFGCILMMILLICNSALNFKGSIKKKEYIIMAAAVIVFMIFFPETSGIAVDRSYIKHVEELVPTWIFE